jgi:hypothetical protein
LPLRIPQAPNNDVDHPPTSYQRLHDKFWICLPYPLLLRTAIQSCNCCSQLANNSDPEDGLDHDAWEEAVH